MIEFLKKLFNIIYFKLVKHEKINLENFKEDREIWKQ